MMMMMMSEVHLTKYRLFLIDQFFFIDLKGIPDERDPEANAQDDLVEDDEEGIRRQRDFIDQFEI